MFWAQFLISFVVQQRWYIVSYYLHLPFSIMFVSTSYLCDSFLLTCCCLLLLLKFLLAMVITVIIVNMDMNQLFSADTFCKQISNDLQSLFWSYHCLFVSICHSMFSFWCVKMFQRVFLYTALTFYFHDINSLHTTMFLCFCKVPHNFQYIDPKLWFF